MKTTKLLITTVVLAVLAAGVLALTGCCVISCCKSESTDDHAHQYTCSMHPEVLRDKPGNCPKCGMKLVEKH